MRLGRNQAFDQQGFDALIDENHRALYDFARRRLGDRTEVEDVLAETFTVAWRRRKDMPDPARPWLFGVCARVISQHRRGERRRRRLWAKAGAAETDTSGRDPAEVHAERSAITEAFARLTEDQREVLRLVAWDGLSGEEAAEVLNCTPGAFRVRLHRARAELAKHLEPDGHEGVQAVTDADASTR